MKGIALTTRQLFKVKQEITFNDKFFDEISGSKHPPKFICICGDDRTKKSLILSTLLENEIVYEAASIEPGISVVEKPIKKGQTETYILLTKGFSLTNEPQPIDIKIFILAILLCQSFIISAPTTTQSISNLAQLCKKTFLMNRQFNVKNLFWSPENENIRNLKPSKFIDFECELKANSGVAYQIKKNFYNFYLQSFVFLPEREKLDLQARIFAQKNQSKDILSPINRKQLTSSLANVVEKIQSIDWDLFEESQIYIMQDGEEEKLFDKIFAEQVEKIQKLQKKFPMEEKELNQLQQSFKRQIEKKIEGKYFQNSKLAKKILYFLKSIVKNLGKQNFITIKQDVEIYFKSFTKDLQKKFLQVEEESIIEENIQEFIQKKKKQYEEKFSKYNFTSMLHIQNKFQLREYEGLIIHLWNRWIEKEKIIKSELSKTIIDLTTDKELLEEENKNLQRQINDNQKQIADMKKKQEALEKQISEAMSEFARQQQCFKENEQHIYDTQIGQFQKKVREQQNRYQKQKECYEIERNKLKVEHEELLSLTSYQKSAISEYESKISLWMTQLSSEKQKYADLMKERKQIEKIKQKKIIQLERAIFRHKHQYQAGQKSWKDFVNNYNRQMDAILQIKNFQNKSLKQQLMIIEQKLCEFLKTNHDLKLEKYSYEKKFKYMQKQQNKELMLRQKQNKEYIKTIQDYKKKNEYLKQQVKRLASENQTLTKQNQKNERQKNTLKTYQSVIAERQQTKKGKGINYEQMKIQNKQLKIKSDRLETQNKNKKQTIKYLKDENEKLTIALDKKSKQLSKSTNNLHQQKRRSYLNVQSKGIETSRNRSAYLNSKEKSTAGITLKSSRERSKSRSLRRSQINIYSQHSDDFRRKLVTLQKTVQKLKEDRRKLRNQVLQYEKKMFELVRISIQRVIDHKRLHGNNYNESQLIQKLKKAQEQKQIYIQKERMYEKKIDKFKNLMKNEEKLNERKINSMKRKHDRHVAQIKEQYQQLKEIYSKINHTKSLQLLRKDLSQSSNYPSVEDSIRIITKSRDENGKKIDRTFD